MKDGHYEAMEGDGAAAEAEAAIAEQEALEDEARKTFLRVTSEYPNFAVLAGTMKAILHAMVVHRFIPHEVKTPTQGAVLNQARVVHGQNSVPEELAFVDGARWMMEQIALIN